MDINSLLSPQETPRVTPTPPVKTTPKKPRKPRASKVAQHSPLAHTTLPPPTLPHNAVVQVQHVANTPTNMSPTSGHRTSIGSNVGTPPADGSRTARQPSTAGMDTLADLASMQHHQQTARVNAGGLRSAEIYDNPTSSASVLPNLLAMSRPQASSQLREPNQLRGGPLDITMTDGPAETPSSRRYSTSALSTSELETVTQLATYLATSPFAYQSHVELINLLHQGFRNHIQQRSSSTAANEPHNYDLLADLQNARETMISRFALGEDLWADWILDQILLGRSLEDRITVMELCQKAVDEEPSSTRLWEIYGQFVLFLYKNANPQDERAAGIGAMATGQALSEEDRSLAREVFTWAQTMDVWRRGAQETALRINDSHRVWDVYTELVLHELAFAPSQDAVAQTQFHFINRLQTPHATWDKTLEIYSNFVSRYDDPSYENTLVAATRLGAEARSKYGVRETMELNVLRASQMNDKEAESQAYSEYIEWELAQSRRKNIFDFGLTNNLYQRATLRFPANTELWEGYAMFLIEEFTHVRRDISVFPVLDKATRHCPWSGTLWSQYLLAAETNKLSFTEVEDIKHRATSSGLLDAGGLEEVLKIHTAWCGFLRRRAFHQDSTDEDMDVAEVGIRSAIENMETIGREKYGKDYQGDPQYRLEKIYIKYLSQARNWDRAREELKKLIPRKGDNYDFWLRYYLWEMATWGKLAYSENSPDGGRPVKPTEATKVLLRGMNRPKLDWPEKIIETFQYHCEDNEDAEELQSSIAQVWKAKKTVQKRREKEAYDSYAAAQADAAHQQQQAQQDVVAANGDNENVSKRKREEDEDAGASKKARSDIPESVESQLEEQHTPTPSLLKRDRENATVVVKNLPIDTTDTRLRQYFRDCGTINSLKLVPEADGGSVTGSIEFDSKEDVLTAQTKDMKIFDGRTIEVQVDSASTLYVCNFPSTADEAWIREKFSKYGEIVDIRFPSLRYNSHRRFCFVQFKLNKAAQSATQLDGESLGGELKLLAKLSDPVHKQDRQGAMYDGRELYLANLDWHATREEVKKAFSKYGRVENVRLPTKRDGSSKGIGYVVFSNKDEATAALEMNLKQFKNRILNIVFSSNDKEKRQIQIITSNSQRTTTSPTPDIAYKQTNGNTHSAASPTPPFTGQSKYAEIQTRTVALLNVPDTVSQARIHALAEPYGELVKVSLRYDHQGAILEYKDVASVGKASLALEGQEIAPGRRLGIGTVNEMKQQKAEYRSDNITAGAAKKEATKMQGPAPIRRPNQTGTRRGGKGGLGFKRGGAGPNGESATKDGEGREGMLNGEGEGHEETGKAKSNADFKAMFLNRGGQ